ncbi:MAG: rhodanese-like domain-containing protein [Syntrophobacteraceae bacterium]
MKTLRGKSFPVEALKQSLLIVLIATAVSLLVNHFRPNGLPLVPPRTSKKASSGSQNLGPLLVSLDEARALFFAHGAVFIDARSAQVYRLGHIQGALNLPAQGFDKQFPAVKSKVSPDSFVIAYCDGEHCSLGREVAMQLLAGGYSHVAVLVNGWTLWRDGGLPTGKGG